MLSFLTEKVKYGNSYMDIFDHSLVTLGEWDDKSNVKSSTFDCWDYSLIKDCEWYDNISYMIIVHDAYQNRTIFIKDAITINKRKFTTKTLKETS